MTTRRSIGTTAVYLLLGLSWLAGTAFAAKVTTHYEYDNAGQVTRQYVETAGQILSDKRVQYDELGRAKQTRELATPGTLNDAEDRITEAAWDIAGNVRLERRKYAGGPGGYVSTTHEYNSFGHKACMIEDVGVNQGPPVQPVRRTTNYGCDNRGHVVSEIDPANNLAQFVYDAAGQPVLEKRYEGLSTLVLQINRVFDSRGHKVVEIQGDGQAGQTFEQALPTALTQQRWEYDALDRLILQAQMVHPDSVQEPAFLGDRVVRYTYVAATQHPYQQITYINDSYLPRYTTFAYDGLGRLDRTVDPNGNSEAYTYVPVGQDGEGQVATRKVTNPGLTDPAGVDISEQEFTYTYDWQGRKKTETAKGKGAVADRLTQYDYDDANRVQTVTNPKNIVTKYYSNAFGDQVKVIEDGSGLARTTEMHYDQLGRMDWQKVTNTGDQIQQTDYAYDLLDHRTRIEFPDDGTYTHVYDNAGRLEQRTDPRGQVTTYTNNWRGQPLTKTVKVSATAPAELKESFTYYPTGWPKAAWMDTATLEAATHKTVFARDAFGQVTVATQTIDGVEKIIASQYYASGHRKQLDYPSDVPVRLNFTQDGLGQTTLIQRNDGMSATYGYAGRKLLWRDVTTAGGGGTHVRFEVGLDAHRQQARLTNRTAVGTTSNILDQTDYTYDPAGNRQTASISAGDQRLSQTAGDGYGYDALDRLTSAAYPAGQSESFGYDRLGNRSSFTDRQGRPNTYGPANTVNQYTSINGVPLATDDSLTDKYDAAGNLLANEHGYGFGYDYENRLVKVYTDSNHNAQWDAGEPVLADYSYDALGHRIKQVKAGRTTRYYYDGQTILAEYDGTSGNLLCYHIHGPTYVDEHIVLHEQAHGPQPEQDYYYLLGPLYSVTGLVSAGGAVAERYRYDAYGLPTWLPGGQVMTLRDYLALQKALRGPGVPYGPGGAAFDLDADGDVDLADYRAWMTSGVGTPGQSISPYRFTGQPLDFQLADATTGQPTLVLYHYRERGYLAYDGRFLQMDPALYQDSMNLYEYVKSQPTMAVDPTGRFSYLELLSTSLNYGMRAYQAYETATNVRGYVEQIAAGVELRSVLMQAAIETAVSHVAGKATGAALDKLIGKLGALTASFAKEGVDTTVTKIARRVGQHFHHLLPKFLQGEPGGLLGVIPAKLHQKFHGGLLKLLSKNGIKLTGEAGDNWTEHFKKHPEHLAQSWDLLLDYMKGFDKAHGTSMLRGLVNQMVKQFEDIFKVPLELD